MQLVVATYMTGVQVVHVHKLVVMYVTTTNCIIVDMGWWSVLQVYGYLSIAIEVPG